MIRHLIYVCATLFACAFSISAANAEWLRAETPNFIIYSEGSEAKLKGYAERLERFDAALRAQFNVKQEVASPLIVYLVPRAADAARLAGDESRFVAGFYKPDAEGTFAVSNREEPGKEFTKTGVRDNSILQLDATEVLFHEYAHHFMLRYFPSAYPSWFVEGFAEYMATTTFTKDGEPEVGRPAYYRAYGLLEMPRLPLDKLLFERPQKLTGIQRETFYGRSWLLVHMLTFSKTRSGQMSSYLNAVANGTDPRAAAVASFGDLAVLEKELAGYVDKPMQYRRLAAQTGDFMPKISRLGAADSALVTLRLERLTAERDEKRLVAARDALKAATAKYPDNSGIWYELAQAEWNRAEDVRDLALAKSSTERALALDPAHARANILRAQMMMDELDDAGDSTPAKWRDARAPLLLANKTNPDDVLALLLWYQSFGRQGVKRPDVARAGLERAFEVAPEVVEIRAAYIFDLVEQGNFDSAINLAKTLAYSPHDDGEGLALLRQIETLRDKANGIVSEENEDAEEFEGADTPAT